MINRINANVVTLHIGELLDFNVLNTFDKIRKLAVCSELQKIVIDLSQTRHIFDSGLAMLLFLSNKTGGLNIKIILINCSQEILNRLSIYNKSTRFQINY